MSGDVLAQIGEIAARVRIRSMTDLDFAGRQIEVPPPLPRRFPLLPMVDCLQSELYQKAYCLPIIEAESTDGPTLRRLTTCAMRLPQRTRPVPGLTAIGL
jgi:hypothetical protein